MAIAMQRLGVETGFERQALGIVDVGLDVAERHRRALRQRQRQFVCGAPDVGIGHDPAGDLTITTDYDTAKQIFVSGDPQAGMQAMMQGKLKIQGDMSKLMAAAAQGGGPGAAGGAALAEAIQGITE